MLWETDKAARLRSLSRVALAILTLTAVTVLCACVSTDKSPDNAKEKSAPGSEQKELTIEAAPVTKGDDQWQVITGNSATLTVTAPGAQSVKVLYRPAFAEGRHVELKKIASPSDAS